MKGVAAIILAAGKGTRMKSNKAKVVFPIAGKSLINRVIDTTLKAGANMISVVVGYKKETVKEIIPDNPKIRFAEQKEQLGTGHAVMVAEENFRNFDGSILVLAGDVPFLKPDTLKKVIDKNQSTNATCTILTAIIDDAGKYGRIVRDHQSNISKIVEFKDANEKERKIKEFNTGIYCFSARELFASLKKIDNNNKQKEYYLTDVLEIIRKDRKKINSIVISDVDEVTGVNSKKQLAYLENKIYDKIKDLWMEKGVRLENPDSIIIGEDVVLEKDVKIAANTILKGKTIIGENSEIGPFSYLNNAIIGKNVTLKGYNLVENSKVDENEKLDYNVNL